MDPSLWTLATAVGLPLLYLIGALSALDAMLRARTAQGATAWIVALLLAAPVALPLYWAFGRSRFEGYAEALRQLDAQVAETFKTALDGELAAFATPPPDGPHHAATRRGFEAVASVPFLRGNGARLLVDGRETFDAVFEAVDAAERYLLVQFYIVRDDGLGRALRDRLVAAARRGVAVWFLYDEVGSASLPRAYRRSLAEAGARVAGFGGERGWLGRFRVNFRNHRKIVVADGRVGLVGGLNVGDEYLGLDPSLSPWRDTHLRVEGPVVQELQLSFARDWRYGHGDVPDGLVWDVSPSDEDRVGLVHASGPADPLESARLLFAHAIGSARERVWIASPYFVPDGHVLGALQAAALRGVDVRVVQPRTTDSVLFKYVPYAYLPEAERAGVASYLYEDGFLHQKAFLVDDRWAAVGTANLDNRSFRLNFEVTALFDDRPFAAEVAAMLEADLARSTRLSPSDLDALPLAARLGAGLTRLLAPVL